MKKSIKLVVIILIVIGILIAVGIAYIKLLAPSQNKAKLFGSYAEKMLEGVKDFFKEEALEQFEQKQQTVPFENKGKLEYAVMYEDTQNELVNINSTLFDFQGKTDSTNQKMETEVKLHYTDNTVFPFTIKQDGSKYGLMINDIMKMYAVIENSNLKQFAEKLGIDPTDIPDKIEMNSDTESLLTQEEWNNLLEKCSKILKDNITVDDFAVEKNQDNKTAYSITLSGEKRKTIYLQLFNQMKDDEILLNKVKTIDINGEGYTQQYLESMNSAIEYIEDLEIEYPVTIKVYETSNGSTDCEVLLHDCSIKVSMISQKLDEKTIVINVIPNVEDGEYQQSLSIRISKIKQEDTIIYRFYGMMKVDTQQSHEIQVEYEIKGLKEVIEDVNENLSAVINSQNANTSWKGGIGIEVETKFQEEINISSFAQENSIVFNDLSKDALNTAMSTLVEKVQTVFINKIEQANQQNPKGGIYELVKIVQQSEEVLIHSARSAAQRLQEQERNERNNLEQVEIKAYNAEFERYQGTISGTTVKTLIQTVKYHNQTSATISINGLSNEAELDNVLQNIQSAQNYTVTFEYDENGYISNILIQ